MIGAKNINAWAAKTKREKNRVQSKATDFVRTKAKAVLNEAIKVSPQWSGDFAAAWELTTVARGMPVGEKTTKFKVDPWQSLTRPWSERRPGGSGPLAYATAQNAEIYPEIKWNSRIILVNAAAAADPIESGEANLRPINLIPGGAGVMAHLKSKFKFIK